jgi:hypothetical protein
MLRIFLLLAALLVAGLGLAGAGAAAVCKGGPLPVSRYDYENVCLLGHGSASSGCTTTERFAPLHAYAFAIEQGHSAVLLADAWQQNADFCGTAASQTAVQAFAGADGWTVGADYEQTSRGGQCEESASLEGSVAGPLALVPAEPCLVPLPPLPVPPL